MSLRNPIIKLELRVKLIKVQSVVTTLERDTVLRYTRSVRFEDMGNW